MVISSFYKDIVKSLFFIDITMIFRKAAESDAKRCLEIYDAISDWEMANRKQCCWEKGFYPTMETVEAVLSEVLVLHTFGVDPAMQKKGYSSAFISFYEKMAYEAGCKTLR